MKMWNRIKGSWYVLNGRASIVQPIMLHDRFVGNFWIHITDRYTRITVGKREFFFTHDGKMDGTGMTTNGVEDEDFVTHLPKRIYDDYEV